MNISIEEKEATRKKVAKPLLWLGIVSMIMLFAGLTSAYVVRHAAGNWLAFELPQLFYLSTALILMSSITMNWAIMSAKKGNLKNIKTALTLTLLLGIGFALSQFGAWSQLINTGIFFTGNTSNASGQFLYILTLLHLLHLAGGIITVSVSLSQSLKEKYNPQNLLGLQLCATYWHFLDILWIYLFLFLLFIR